MAASADRLACLHEAGSMQTEKPQSEGTAAVRIVISDSVCRFPTVGLTTQVQRDRPKGHLSNTRPQRSLNCQHHYRRMKLNCQSLFQQDSAAISSDMTAFCACRRFSASSNTTLCGPSITSAATSSPRCAGRQWRKIQSFLATLRQSALI